MVRADDCQEFDEGLRQYVQSGQLTIVSSVL